VYDVWVYDVWVSGVWVYVVWVSDVWVYDVSRVSEYGQTVNPEKIQVCVLDDTHSSVCPR